MRKTYGRVEDNQEICKMHQENETATREGQLSIDLFKDLPVLRVQFLVESPERTLLDHTTNLCKWVDNQKGTFLISFFKNYVEKHFNSEVFHCPIKKGFLIIAKDRDKTVDASFLPSFIPMRGLVNVTIRVKTIIRKRSISLYNSTETYEFYEES